MAVTISAVKAMWLKVGEVRRAIWQNLGELWQVVVCYGYAIIWESKEQTRQWLTASARVVLIVSSLLFLIEAAGNVFDEHLYHIKLPWYVKTVVIILAAWMVRHRWKEMRNHQRAIVFTRRMADLFKKLSPMNLVRGEKLTRESNLRAYIETVLGEFSEVFEEGSRPELSVMTLDGGVLTITYFHPPASSYDLKFYLKRG
jgi:hypothetical protein